MWSNTILKGVLNLFNVFSAANSPLPLLICLAAILICYVAAPQKGQPLLCSLLAVAVLQVTRCTLLQPTCDSPWCSTEEHGTSRKHEVLILACRSLQSKGACTCDRGPSFAMLFPSR